MKVLNLKLFLSILILIFISCSSDKKNKEEEENTKTQDDYTNPDKTKNIKFKLSSSTMQLITDSVDPSFCPSGWTMFKKSLETKNRDHLVPLQKKYVTRFKNLKEFETASIKSLELLDTIVNTMRIPILWPCWVSNIRWKQDMIETIKALKKAGWKIEIVLSHHDSYPADLHNNDILNSGWANKKASQEFNIYVDSVLKEFKDILPQGTSIVLINEPIAYLFNAYLGIGSWPPGGKRAAKAFTKAILNMRNALSIASEKIYTSGFIPAISKNIKPITNISSEESKALNYIFNFWLLDALISGCIDDNFDTICEKKENITLIKELGITFYGTATADHYENVEIGLEHTKTKFSILQNNVSSDTLNFEKAIDLVLEKYYKDYSEELKINISEVGFSFSDLDKSAKYFKGYRQIIATKYALEELDPLMTIHTLFESAEFQEGDWNFHIIKGCLDSPCEFTPWGKRLFQEIKWSWQN